MAGNTRLPFQTFLLFNSVTSAVTAYISVFKQTVHDPGNSSDWNTKFVHHLFLALRKFDLNED